MCSVEETASSNVIFNNTCENNTGNGIGVYSIVVGPVMGNAIVGNTCNRNGNSATKYTSHGISTSGKGKDGVHISKNNVVIGNNAANNRNGEWFSGRQFNHSSGDFWAHNITKITFATGAAPAPGVLTSAESTLVTLGVPQASIDAFKTAVAGV